MIDRMKGSAAQRAGDNARPSQAFEAVSWHRARLAGAEQAQVAESLAFAYSQQKNWAKTTEWVNRARAAGGNSAQLNQLSAYVQSQSGDYAQIFKDAQAQVERRRAAGRRPAEDDLLRLADAAKRVNNHGAYSHALDKPGGATTRRRNTGARTWRACQRKPGFADRLSLDVMRLKLANGLISKTDDLHGDGAAGAAGRLSGRGQGDRRQGLRRGRAGHGRPGRAPQAAEGPGHQAAGRERCRHRTGCDRRRRA